MLVCVSPRVLLPRLRVSGAPSFSKYSDPRVLVLFLQVFTSIRLIRVRCTMQRVTLLATVCVCVSPEAFLPQLGVSEALSLLKYSGFRVSALLVQVLTSIHKIGVCHTIRSVVLLVV